MERQLIRECRSQSTLSNPKSVCYISKNTYSASFHGAKDAASCSIHGKIGSATGDEGAKGKWKGKGWKGRGGMGIKEGEGKEGGHFASRGWKREGRKGKENKEGT